MRKYYSDPEVEILRFHSEDVIAVSNPGNGEHEDGDELDDV